MSDMEIIPIQSLSLDNAPDEGTSIRGIVTLSWPYSSSTRQCALLIADLDFRLRAKKGQVRVRFTAASAEAIAKAHIGIGDEVVLQLQGAKWAQDIEVTRTPGRSVDGELLYRNRLGLTLAKADGSIEIDINATTPPRVTEQLENVITATPLRRTVQTVRSSFNGSLDSPPTYSSPPFAQRQRLSSNTFLGSGYDPFFDVDLDVEHPAKRQRTSFGTIGQWRYAEGSPSPEESLFDGDVTGEVIRGNDEMLEVAQDTLGEARIILVHAPGVAEVVQPEDAMQIDSVSLLDQATALNSDVSLLPDISPTSVIPDILPITIPALQPSELHASHLKLSIPGPHITSAEEEVAPSTPLLQAVPNSALPNPSPFASKTTLTHAARTDDDSAPTEEIVSTVTSPVGFSQPGKQDEGSTIVEGAADLIINGLEPGKSGALQEAISDAAESGGQAAASITTVARDDLFAAPSTPIKLPGQAFGFDGSSSAKSEARITPQSERERVMAQTFRSLFGFAKAPMEQTKAAQRSPSPAPQVQGPKGVSVDGHDFNPGSVSLISTRSKHSLSQSPLPLDHNASAQTRGITGADAEMFQAAATEASASQVQRGVPIDSISDFTQDLSQDLAKHGARGLDDSMVADTASSAPEVIDLLSSSDIEGQVGDEEEHVAEDEQVEDEEIEDGQADDGRYVETYKRKLDPKLGHLEALADFTEADDSVLSDRDEATTYETNELSTQQDYMAATQHEDGTIQSPFIPDSYEDDQIDSSSQQASDARLPARTSHFADKSVTQSASRSDVYSERPLGEALQSMEGGESLGATDHSLSSDDDIEQRRSNLKSPPPQSVDQEDLQDLDELGAVSPGSPARDDMSQWPPVASSHPTEIVELASSSPVPLMDTDHIADGVNETTGMSATNVAQSPAFDDLMVIDAGGDPAPKLYDVHTPRRFSVEFQVSEFASQAEIRSKTFEYDDVEQTTLPKIDEYQAIEFRRAPPAVSDDGDQIVVQSSSPPVDDTLPRHGSLHEATATFEELAIPANQDQIGSSSSIPQVNELLDEHDAHSSPIEPAQGLQLPTQVHRPVQYSSLPPTPIESQSRTDHDFSSTVDDVQRRLQSSALPHTPQLTQKESDLQVYEQPTNIQDSDIPSLMDEHTLAEQEVHEMQIEEVETIALDVGLHGDAPKGDLMDLDVSNGLGIGQSVDKALLGGSDQGIEDDVSLVEPEAQTPEIQGPAEASLHEARDDPLSGGVVDKEEHLEGTEANCVPTELQLLPKDTHAPAELRERKTTARKSLKSRLSNVPDVISAWFSPKGSGNGGLAGTTTATSVAKRASKQAPGHDVHDLTKDHQAGTEHTGSSHTSDGVLTTMAYFTSLSDLHRKLNMSSQDFHGANTVDVLAVAADSTKAPERAKGGPRDYYTIFRVMDTSLDSNTAVRVEVFRPWKAVLPVAEVGDVILLRSFTIKSRKRQPYLLSTDASAWCVWRYAEGHKEMGEDTRPVWAHKHSESHTGEVREEIKGPPVELGAEERRHADALRNWWMTAHANGRGNDSHDVEDERTHEGLTGEVAKL
ncbi:hypothetical protein LTR78_000234 [Recurvomyces mirabilis]|uniref:Telomeric single stranded DNA binding POT1/Cdc13 domain-containing protein n=1 Tax=Recurvomyces mirabilis TaxID=574656 RepID=A0AAE0WXL8_9PEZI|nr:hypothetical protein LTR78_000234 [Recurvomyces mirabilis]KAK5161890.1 hypothetical protein LTS14_000235 [Recurvomyces mirabilis]